METVAAPPRVALPWTRSWRKIYQERAQTLGYNCQWASGELMILSPTGSRLHRSAPKGKTFFMEDLIAEARSEEKKREAERIAEAKRKEERYEENLARASAGEPIFILRAIRKKKQERERSHMMRSFLPAVAMLGASAGPLGGRMRF